MITQSCRRHRHQEFLRFLTLIDGAVPKDPDLHLVLDNYATHKSPAIHQWLLKHSPLPPALHADQLIMAQPGRALVRRADRPETPPVSPPQPHRARERYPLGHPTINLDGRYRTTSRPPTTGLRPLRTGE